jgi:hypothetical protein
MKHLQWISAGFLAAAFLLAGGKAWGAPPAQANPAYTRPEYNAYLAAHLEGNPAKKIKLLDDFVGKYPASTLLVEAYQDLPILFRAEQFSKDHRVLRQVAGSG